jgi:hypothetical protein
MANVLNRTTKELRFSVNTPDFPASDWIESPDMTAVAGFPPKYWDIVGDAVTLKDAAGRDAADSEEAATLAAQAAAFAAKAIADGAKAPSPAGATATIEERLRALEKVIFGV